MVKGIAVISGSDSSLSTRFRFLETGDSILGGGNTDSLHQVTGTLNVSGTVSGTIFYGDGSGLTNITASEIPAAGSDWEVQYNIDDDLEASPNLTFISASVLALTGTLDISGSLTASSLISASYFYGDGSGLTNITASEISAAGSEWELQYNVGGDLEASSNFTFVSASSLQLTGSLFITGTGAPLSTERIIELKTSAGVTSFFIDEQGQVVARGGQTGIGSVVLQVGTPGDALFVVRSGGSLVGNLIGTTFLHRIGASDTLPAGNKPNRPVYTRINDDDTGLTFPDYDTVALTAAEKDILIVTTSSLGTPQVNISGNVEVSGNVSPVARFSHNLGSPAKPWNRLYVGHSSIHFVSESTEVGTLEVNDSSVLTYTGSTLFGNTTADTHTFTGSFLQTGSGATSVFTDNISVVGSLTSSVGLHVSSSTGVATTSSFGAIVGNISGSNPNPELHLNTSVRMAGPFIYIGDNTTDSVYVSARIGAPGLIPGQDGEASSTDLGIPSRRYREAHVVTGSYSILSASVAVSASTYYGDGSNLTNITASEIEAAGDTNDIQYNLNDDLTGSTNFTFDGSDLRLTGSMFISGTAPQLTIDSIPAADTPFTIRITDDNQVTFNSNIGVWFTAGPANTVDFSPNQLASFDRGAIFRSTIPGASNHLQVNKAAGALDATSSLVVNVNTGYTGLNSGAPEYQLDVFGDARVTGSTIFGNSSSDTHIFSGSLDVSGNVVPHRRFSHNLGSPFKPWNTLYVGHHSIHFMSESAEVGILSVTGSTLTYTGSTAFGSDLADTHIFSGSFFQTGSGATSIFKDSINVGGILYQSWKEVVTGSAGDNWQIQYNSGSLFTGSSDFTFNGGNLHVTGTLDVNGAISGTTFYGSGAGLTAVTASEIEAAGDTNDIQYNLSDDLTGSNNFTFDNSTLKLTGTLDVSGSAHIEGPLTASNGLRVYNIRALDTGNREMAISHGEVVVFDDFRAGINNNPDTLVIDYTADKMAVRKNLPLTGQVADFDVSGSSNFSGSVDVLGSLSASLNISASSFYGDGSNLTNITASEIEAAGDTNDIQYNLNDDLTGSNNFTFDNSTLHLTGAAIISGSITTTGGNKFGNALDDVHQFTGSILLQGSGSNPAITVRDAAGDLNFAVYDDGLVNVRGPLSGLVFTAGTSGTGYLQVGSSFGVRAVGGVEAYNNRNNTSARFNQQNAGEVNPLESGLGFPVDPGSCGLFSQNAPVLVVSGTLTHCPSGSFDVSGSTRVGNLTSDTHIFTGSILQSGSGTSATIFKDKVIISGTADNVPVLNVHISQSGPEVLARFENTHAGGNGYIETHGDNGAGMKLYRAGTPYGSMDTSGNRFCLYGGDVASANLAFQIDVHETDFKDSTTVPFSGQTAKVNISASQHPLRIDTDTNTNVMLIDGNDVVWEANHHISGDANVTGTLDVSGSTRFGKLTTDTHQITGSLLLTASSEPLSISTDTRETVLKIVGDEVILTASYTQQLPSAASEFRLNRGLTTAAIFGVGGNSTYLGADDPVITATLTIGDNHISNPSICFKRDGGSAFFEGVGADYFSFCGEGATAVDPDDNVYSIRNDVGSEGFFEFGDAGYLGLGVVESNSSAVISCLKINYVRLGISRTMPNYSVTSIRFPKEGQIIVFAVDPNLISATIGTPQITITNVASTQNLAGAVDFVMEAGDTLTMIGVDDNGTVRLYETARSVNH